jgi:hypothetical protein
MSLARHKTKDIKKGLDLEEARRKREENIIELRKTKRDENLQKKRQTFAAPQYAIEDSNKAGSGGQRVSSDLELVLFWGLRSGPSAPAFPLA